MANDIQIQKTTILLALGLLVAVVAGAYVFGSGASPAPSPQDNATGKGGLLNAIQEPLAAIAAPQAAPRTGGGGCGIGGGGATAAPDPSKAVLVNSTNASSQGDVQDIYIKAKNDGTYDREEVTVNAGSPVRLHFTADPDAGCGRQMVIYGLNIKAVSTNGEENVVEFIPKQAGTYEYNCGMRMWRAGRLVVV